MLDNVEVAEYKPHIIIALKIKLSTVTYPYKLTISS